MRVEQKMKRLEVLREDLEWARRKIRRDVLVAWIRDDLEKVKRDDDPDWYIEAVEKFSGKMGRSYKHIMWTVNPREGID